MIALFAARRQSTLSCPSAFNVLRFVIICHGLHLGMAEEMASSDSRAPPLVKTDSQAMRSLDQQDKPADIPEGFPATLEGFKYAFNEEGQLRHTETGEAYVFKFYEEHSKNQKRYEALGEIITEYVYNLLETEANLKKITIPVDAKGNEPSSFFFASEDAFTNPSKLMVLIHGSGVVRAGQWSRKLIINESLDSGTQLPFIKRAQKEGYGVVVLNTNDNYIKKKKKEVPIKQCDNPCDHANYVWNHFISTAAARRIAVIAHSYGGIVTVDLGVTQQKDFLKRVFAVAFTDSVHSLNYQDVPKAVMKFFQKFARNWVSSDDPVDSPVQIRGINNDVTRVSAGHPKHENTSWAAFESIFKFLTERYEQTVKDEL